MTHAGSSSPGSPGNSIRLQDRQTMLRIRIRLCTSIRIRIRLFYVDPNSYRSDANLRHWSTSLRGSIVSLHGSIMSLHDSGVNLNSLSIDSNLFLLLFLKLNTGNFQGFGIYGYRKGKTTNLFLSLPLFCCCWILDPRWKNFLIRDKHPGSATLILLLTFISSFLL